MLRLIRPLVSRFAFIAVTAVTLTLPISNCVSATAIQLTEARLNQVDSHRFRLTLAATGHGIRNFVVMAGGSSVCGQIRMKRVISRRTSVRSAL